MGEPIKIDDDVKTTRGPDSVMSKKEKKKKNSKGSGGCPG